MFEEAFFDIFGPKEATIGFRSAIQYLNFFALNYKPVVEITVEPGSAFHAAIVNQDVHALNDILGKTTRIHFKGFKFNFEQSVIFTSVLKQNTTVTHIVMDHFFYGHYARYATGLVHFMQMLRRKKGLRNLEFINSDFSSLPYPNTEEAVSRCLKAFWLMLEDTSAECMHFISNLFTNHELRKLARILRKRGKVISVISGRLGGSVASLLATAIQENESLEWLSLERNDIDFSVLGTILSAVTVNRSLRYLNLDNNRVGNRCAPCICEMLQKNTVLSRISLKNNFISEKAVNEIASALLYYNVTLVDLEIDDASVLNSQSSLDLQREHASSSIEQLDAPLCALALIMRSFDWFIVPSEIDHALKLIQQSLERNRKLLRIYNSIKEVVNGDISAPKMQFDDDVIFVAIAKGDYSLVESMLDVKPELRDHKLAGRVTLEEFASTKDQEEISSLLRKQDSRLGRRFGA